MPEVLSVGMIDAEAVALDLQVSASLAMFDGHFPDVPLVPGVAQVDWAIAFAKAHGLYRGTFTTLHDLKFVHAIEPPATLQLTLRWDEARAVLAFRFTLSPSGRCCSSGKIGVLLDDA